MISDRFRVLRSPCPSPGRVRFFGRALVAVGGLAAVGLLSIAGAPAAVQAPGGERHATLFYTAEVHGAVEPCGCTSDPLGDVSRLAALMAEARRSHEKAGPPSSKASRQTTNVPAGRSALQDTGVALMDAGGLLYPEGAISARERPSADLRAAFLAAQFESLGLLGATFGETDASSGSAHVRPARLASNLAAGGALLEPAHVASVGGIAIGVLGIADPTVAQVVSAKAEDMAVSARRDVERLRKAGAEVVVLLAAVEKGPARKLARDSGADVVVLGKRVAAGMPRMERVGRAYLVAPADELQRVGRLEIVLRGPPGTTPVELQDGGGAEAARARREEIGRTLERLNADLAKWSENKPANKGGAATGASSSTGSSPSPTGDSDAAFVAAKRREQGELQAEKARLEAPWLPPATGSYLINSLIPLRRTLPRDPRVVAAMKKLDQGVAAVNLKQATPPPPPESGRTFYVGMDKCTSCHAGATKFWRGTVHAHAWRTLVEGGKQADYKCIGCHVTGFGQVGGSALGFTKKLESVQCETCHGPGSAHVAGEGNEEPLAIKRDTPETVCQGCHTEQHSDTFQYEPYLRDVVGAGHGPARRTKLGPGVTGHELRATALKKAKLAGVAQVKKM